MRNLHIEWQKKYEIGIEEIDFQHKYFLKTIGRIAALLNASEDKKYQAALISEVNAYAAFHFLSEENLMTQYGYPGLAEHRSQHFDLIQELSVRQSIFLGERSRENVNDLIDFLLTWFYSHTVSVDKCFANYLNLLGKET